MILYLDTSALIKLVIEETESADVIELFNQAETIGSALITHVEMASALSKLVRIKSIEPEGGQTAWLEFTSQWPKFTKISITSGLISSAGRLAWEYDLRGYDATQLAAALFWQNILEKPITLATFDKQLWQAGKEIGTEVWPAELPKKSSL